MENSPTFCELDYKITSSEIMKAISKLKSGKAVGLDSLPVHKTWGYFPCF
jgi:hypothetical protein